MIKLSNEVKIGLMVLIAIIIAFIGIRIMRDQSLFKKSTLLYTKFGNVSGLSRGDVILIKGFKVGTVADMKLEESDSTLVVMNINEGVIVTKGSRIFLKSSGVLEDKYLELQRNREIDEPVKSGDFLEGDYELGVFDTIGEKGGELVTQISSSINGIEELVQNLNETLTDDNKNSITTTLTEFAQISQELRHTLSGKKDEIDAITASTKKILANVEDLTTDKKEELGNMISNLESVSGKLNALSDELNEATLSLNRILKKIDNADGTMGKLVADPSLYNNLDSLAVNLNSLIREIQTNPKKYLKYMRLVDIF